MDHTPRTLKTKPKKSQLYTYAFIRYLEIVKMVLEGTRQRERDRERKEIYFLYTTGAQDPQKQPLMTTWMNG
jgi:hypothetical protein